jgi:hypothetical protein
VATVEPPPPPPTPKASVAEVNGRAEVRRKDAETWETLRPGDRVQTADVLRTHENGDVRLEVGDLRVRVGERSELSVQNVEENALDAQLVGSVESDAKGESRVEIRAAGSDAVVRSQGAHFFMTSDGHGVAAVSTVRGAVKLFAAGKGVDVRQGQISHVKPGGAPKAPALALKQVLLAVEWPSERETNRRDQTIEGAVEVGARVTVNGMPARVDPDGRFKTTTELGLGTRKVVVEVQDVRGRRRQLTETFVIDDKKPVVKLKENPWRRRPSKR